MSGGFGGTVQGGGELHEYQRNNEPQKDFFCIHSKVGR